MALRRDKSKRIMTLELVWATLKELDKKKSNNIKREEKKKRSAGQIAKRRDTEGLHKDKGR